MTANQGYVANCFSDTVPNGQQCWRVMILACFLTLCLTVNSVSYDLHEFLSEKEAMGAELRGCVYITFWPYNSTNRVTKSSLNWKT